MSSLRLRSAGKEQFHFSPTAVSENVGALVLPQVESEVAIGPHLQRGTCWCGLSDYLQKGCGARCFVCSTAGAGIRRNSDAAG